MSDKSKLIIGISSRALFNLDESHEIYKKEGLDSYRDYQIANEEKDMFAANDSMQRNVVNG